MTQCSVLTQHNPHASSPVCLALKVQDEDSSQLLLHVWGLCFPVSWRLMATVPIFQPGKLQWFTQPTGSDVTFLQTAHCFLILHCLGPQQLGNPEQLLPANKIAHSYLSVLGPKKLSDFLFDMIFYIFLKAFILIF